MTDQEYAALKRKLLAVTNINLDDYKSEQMRRRLDGLISSTSRSIALFCRLLDNDEATRTKVTNFLTINVSEFFRDESHFDVLKNKILPQLERDSRCLKVWTAGCSHGGEPYSIAMMLEELYPNRKHRILATDVDRRILAKAKNGGPYTRADVANVKPGLLVKHFEMSNGSYTVNENLRSKVEFKVQNMLEDKFEGGFDLVVCRNVVIYFTDEAKAVLNTKLIGAIKSNGVLFIGATETLLDSKGLGLTRLYPAFYQKSQAAASPRKGERLAIPTS